MSFGDRTPVVVATGQAIERDELVTPIQLATRACDAAFRTAPSLRSRVDRLSMVNVLSGGGRAPASDLAQALALSPHSVEVSTIGGNSPQWLVNRAAAAVAAGEVEVVLIAGSEAQRSRQVVKAGRASVGVQSSGPGPQAGGRTQAGGRARGRPWRPDAERTAAEALSPTPDPMVGDLRPGAGPTELSAGLVAPVHLYALFESVLAHRAGRSFAEHRSALGDLMAPFTGVAARNPFAWFRESLTPRDLSEISGDNRLVSEPYPKRMCAVMQVDQAAAVLVTSLAAARSAGVDDSCVFCWSGADACDVWFPTARPDLGSSQGIAAATSAALKACGSGIDEIAAIDLYSCFPCVVEMAVEALGLDASDSRDLTVTGGLAYFGGPGNDYTLHAVATMIEQLRERGGAGLVTGLGWYATKHSVGIYGDTPPSRGWKWADTSEVQEKIDASAMEVLEPADLESEIDAHHGVAARATVVASTVAHDRDGTVSAAPVVAELADGRRIAVAAAEAELASLAGRNLVGERIAIAGSPIRYRVGD